MFFGMILAVMAFSATGNNRLRAALWLFGSAGDLCYAIEKEEGWFGYETDWNAAFAFCQARGDFIAGARYCFLTRAGFRFQRLRCLCAYQPRRKGAVSRHG